MQFLMRNLVRQHTDIPGVQSQGTLMVDNSLRYLDRLSHLNVFIGPLALSRNLNRQHLVAKPFILKRTLCG